jgi:hypothetical protein
MERSFDVDQQMEVLHSRYLGCGTSDTTKDQWIAHQQADLCASYLGNVDMLVYFSTVENVSLERKRIELLNKLALSRG